ncbi:hypothetical protein PHET_05055 [Paragonimus heterotremus]|uniref:Uncharacterized protein n=1 Tax=Paragonimus heterotremus TaxID=100268 RepID=A0A8J4SPZ3_9TREM|nr:hypothetical protein PHET_05055 [Paragonimus heterotremus]
MEVQIPFGDLEKFVPLPGHSYPPNPYYITADYYYPVQQMTDGTDVESITVAMDEQRNLKSYKFTNRAAYVKGTEYRAPDFYSSQDSLIQVAVRLHPKAGKYLMPTVDRSETGVLGYALASFYKRHRTQFHYSSLDHMKKSSVPILEMGNDQYLLLGLSIDGTVGNLSNLWSGECLHDPSTADCRARGFSLSLWIKLPSISKDRSRFILSTGNSGTGVGECSIGRGVSIFTDKLSLGASVSHQYTDWMLLQDSSNIEEDGVQSTSSDEGGTTANTNGLAQPYVVSGRLNDRNRSTWLTPYMADWENSCTGGQNSPSWEMAHFAVGEVAYFNRFPEPREHKKFAGLLGISELRNFEGQIWTGAELVDSPIDHLTGAAVAIHSRPGPVYLRGKTSQVSPLQEPEIVEFQRGGGLHLNIPQWWQCKTNENFCLQLGARA